MLYKLLFKKIELWIVLLLTICFLVTSVLFGSVVRHVAKGGVLLGTIGDVAEIIAKFPGRVIILFKSNSTEISPQIFESKSLKGLQIYNQEQTDNEKGYLLVSSYNAEGSYVFLFDPKNNKILHKWKAPLSEVYKLAPGYIDGINTSRYYRSQHPLLFENGDLVFSSGDGPMLRLSQCNNIKWINSDRFHHSIHLDKKNNYIYAVKTFKRNNKNKYFFEDGFSIINAENGKTVKEFSISKILLKSKDNLGLIYGVGDFEKDRYHLNSVKPIMESDNFFKKDDLVLSVRNLSTIFVYRPSTNEIIWQKIGPWINQHDARYLGDGIFSVFSNNIIRGLPQQLEFILDHSDVYFYDMKNNQISRPYKNIMKNSKQRSGGIYNPIFDNGGIMELHSDAKILRVSKEHGIIWSYENYLGNSKKGNINWSRYILKDEINLEVFKNKCKT